MLSWPSFVHRVATCKLDQRCLWCRGFRHIACDYKQPRRVGDCASSGHTLVHFIGLADLGGLHAHGGVMTSTTAPATGGRRRLRKRRRKRQTTPTTTSIASDALLGLNELPSGMSIPPPSGIVAATGVAADGNDHSAEAAQAPSSYAVWTPMLCLPELDSLVEAMCAADGPPALVISLDPMLEELLAATFTASCAMLWQPPPGVHGATPSGGCPLALAVGAGASASHASSGGSARR